MAKLKKLLDENDCYKYLGVLELNQVMTDQMKEKVSDEV